MKYFFRSRSAKRIRLAQIMTISQRSNLSPAQIEKWYQRFILCYPDGYVSYEEFVIYIKQIYIYHGNDQNQLLLKPIIKQMFSQLDIDNDKQLNFEEFFQFNLLINQSSDSDKLKFILNLYDQNKPVYYKQQDIIEILIHLFRLFNISKLAHNLSEKIEQILIHTNLYNQTKKISWNIFCISILNHTDLFESLLTNNSNEENFLTYF